MSSTLRTFTFNPNLKKLFQNFTNYKNYFKDLNNPLWHEVKDKILSFKPEWVGYTSYTANISAIKIISENETVVVDFYADWCISCKVMEREVFSQPGAAQLMSKFTLVQADVTENNIENQRLLENFGLFGPPSILFFDAEGNEFKQFRVMGEMNEEQFSDQLKAVLASI